jgi:hypothetical protein
MTLTINFAEYIAIKSALRVAASEARAEGIRGQRYENYDMALHYEEETGKLESLIEKLESQVLLNK